MTSKANNAHPLDLPKIVGVIGSIAPALMVRFIPLLFRFRQQAKKGAQIFHKQLVEMGLDAEVAQQLTTEYLAGSDLIKLLHVFSNKEE
ncbi:MAG: hypothetical protein KKC68_03965 [Candidatus Thermoplasmatota archaeon]|nr:hypothetical protein [Candidatus Thermoplasmatota archaeon]MBU1940907.1 hypothetical protein [Candidatus Thermoplasmatota archaeon]